tara:strand:+ start:2052 stop:2669 length:618 start_codon:yes stop_codon:yes gene_type:complete
MKKLFIKLSLQIFIIFSFAIATQKGEQMMGNNLEKATFGGGCFWCVEAVFERIDGVSDVISGYAGGHTKNPTYYEVTSGKTGHAEVCQITFDPAKISYDELLDIFWQAHDPTTLNRQGNDKGTQYRSAIYFHNNSQQKSVNASIEKAKKLFKDPITTEIKALDQFYIAEVNHQDYFANNPNVPYCTFVIAPKINKLEKKGLFNEE